jgi:hypothetical protein
MYFGTHLSTLNHQLIIASMSYQSYRSFYLECTFTSNLRLSSRISSCPSEKFVGLFVTARYGTALLNDTGSKKRTVPQQPTTGRSSTVHRMSADVVSGLCAFSPQQPIKVCTSKPDQGLHQDVDVQAPQARQNPLTPRLTR